MMPVKEDNEEFANGGFHPEKKKGKVMPFEVTREVGNKPDMG